MKTYHQISIALIFILFFKSCSDKENSNSTARPDTIQNTKESNILNNIRKYWPEGTFVQYFENEKYAYVERWIKNKDIYLMEGNYMQIHPFTDTLFRIWGKLVLKDEVVKMFYQTNKSIDEIEFVLSKNDERIFVFENPFRGFPSVMKYTIESDSAFEVLERGFVNGTEKESVYHVKLLK